MRDKEIYTKEFHSLDLNLLFCWDLGRFIFSRHRSVSLSLSFSVFSLGVFGSLATKKESLGDSDVFISFHKKQCFGLPSVFCKTSIFLRLNKFTGVVRIQLSGLPEANNVATVYVNR